MELINQAWSKQKLKHRAKNVTKFVARTTAVSYWVASVILWQDNLKGRIRAFTKIINIAEVFYFNYYFIFCDKLKYILAFI